MPALSPGLLRAWITVFPREPVGHYAAGLRHRSAGRDQEARASFERASRQGPTLEIARAYLAEQLLNRGRSTEAYELSVRCLDKDPTMIPALVVMGRLHAQREEWQKALQHADSAVANDPSFPEAWLLKARLCVTQGDWESCRSAAQRAVQLRPSLAEGWVLAARSAGRLGRLEEALAAAREAARLQPLSPGAQACLGEALFACGFTPEAERVLREVKGDSLDADRAGTALAQVLLAQGRVREAIRWATPLQQRRPLINEARKVLAEGYARLGDRAQERRWRREYQRWARFLAEKERLERALFDVNYDQGPHFQLAQLFAHMGLWSDAMRHGRRAFVRVSHPSSREFWMRLQEAYAVRNDPARRATALLRLDASPRPSGGSQQAQVFESSSGKEVRKGWKSTATPRSSSS